MKHGIPPTSLYEHVWDKHLRTEHTFQYWHASDASLYNLSHVILKKSRMQVLWPCHFSFLKSIFLKCVATQF